MVDIIVPELAESITEGTIAQWMVAEGDYVNQGDTVVELETDKVNLEVSAESSGVLTNIKAQEGDDVEVDDVIGTLDENAEAGTASSSAEGSSKEESSKEESSKEETKKASKAPEKDEKPAATSSESKESTDETDQQVASPAARKLAREKGIDLNSVQTQDPMGRVRTEDVKNAANQPKASSGKSSGSEKSAAPSSESEDRVERQPMSRRRKTIANRLVEVQSNAAMLTTFNEVDMTNIMDVRKRRKETFLKQHDVKLGFMSFFTKAAVGALKAFPQINAEIDGDDILYKKYYDIGIAVSAKEGLVVPVIRNADRKSFAEIEQEVLDLSSKARDNKLGLKDIQGGSFTITNGGIFGSLLSTPILNGSQVGILGMHTIQNRPVAIDENRMENRPMMYLAVSYDHRIVDGAEAVSFLVKMKELLEDPESLLLEG